MPGLILLGGTVVRHIHEVIPPFGGSLEDVSVHRIGPQGQFEYRFHGWAFDLSQLLNAELLFVPEGVSVPAPDHLLGPHVREQFSYWRVVRICRFRQSAHHGMADVHISLVHTLQKLPDGWVRVHLVEVALRPQSVSSSHVVVNRSSVVLLYNCFS